VKPLASVRGARAREASTRVARAMTAHGAFESAAAIAFWFFLSLVPLLVLVGFFLGLVARSKGVDALVLPLLDVVPGEAQQIVRSEVERLATGSAPSLAPLGMVGYLWTASSGLHNLMDVLETVAQAKPRPWWKQRAVALVWVVLGLLTAVLLAWSLVEIDSFFHEHSGHIAMRTGAALQRHVRRGLSSPHEPVIATVLLLGAGMTLLAGFYRTAVERSARLPHPVWPGTVSAVVSWLAVSWGFGAYAVSIGNYALYYGGLAAVAVLLVWLYLTSLSLVVGAEVNAQLGLRRT
jgi:membrane protein